MRQLASFILLTFAAATASAQGAAKTGDDGLKWGPAPAVFPAGVQMAVVQGDPGSSSLFTVRLRFPNGYKVAPHTHPTDENLTVISGMRRNPAEAHGTTVVQVHAIGPFSLTYVNPADAPKAVAGK